MKTIEQIKKAFDKKGYVFFEKGDLNLNVFAVRNKDRKSNVFNDTIYCVFKVGGKWQIHQWKCTTDPGMYYLKNPISDLGTAILVPNQYRGSHKLDLHRGKYKALCQRKPVAVYRDADRDGEYDMVSTTIQWGSFGINIHKAGENESEAVNSWSAGCTVFKNDEEYDKFIGLAENCALAYGNSFTYTLFDEKEL